MLKISDNPKVNSMFTCYAAHIEAQAELEGILSRGEVTDYDREKVYELCCFLGLDFEEYLPD